MVDLQSVFTIPEKMPANSINRLDNWTWTNWTIGQNDQVQPVQFVQIVQLVQPARPVQLNPIEDHFPCLSFQHHVKPFLKIINRKLMSNNWG